MLSSWRPDEVSDLDTFDVDAELRVRRSSLNPLANQMTCVCNHHFSRFVARELLDMIFAMGAKLTNRIQMVSRGRFFSHHAHAIVYFDSRHRVTKTRLEGGLIGELVEGLEPQDIFPSSDWPKRSYRHQLETINRGDGVSVIEF